MNFGFQLSFLFVIYFLPEKTKMTINAKFSGLANFC